MENATKALMIAAAVIVAILIISLVMGIFNTGAEQAENANLDEYAIQQHNDKFRKYEGDNKRGSEVNALLTAVFNHNIAQDNEDTCVLVDGNTEASISKSPTQTTSPKKVSTASRYDVSVSYNTTTKLIDKITINTAGTTTPNTNTNPDQNPEG